MRAIVQRKYGPPDILQLREIDRPAPRADEVLIHVHSAALHRGDCFTVRGAPFPVRAAAGLLRPRIGIPGFDVAGRVEAVGPNVKRLRPGDEVFGTCRGACAEYACAGEDRFVPKPPGLTFEQAAAVPTSGLAALHGLRDAGELRPGQNVLVNGASGGVGTFAVQIGKSLGAHVTAVCSTGNVERMRSIGADDVVDYTREDFTRAARRYDVILDNVENHSLSDCRRALSPRGTLILNSGSGARGLRLLARLVWPLLLSPFVRQRLRRYVSTPRRTDLLALRELIESGAVAPVVDRTYPLVEVPDALRYLEAGHARGKVVIAVARDDVHQDVQSPGREGGAG